MAKRPTKKAAVESAQETAAPASPRARRPARAAAKSRAGLQLEDFRAVPAPRGPSLEKLGQALAERLTTGVVPYEGEDQHADAARAMVGGEEFASFAAQVAASITGPTHADDSACEITPRTVLEALLFVGHPNNEPLAPAAVAEQMRGVRPAEIDGLVQELNEEYAANQCPYTIVSHSTGYRLALREEFEPLRERVFGRHRQVRLSQGAIEVLAAVAYHQPVTAEKVHDLRGAPSGAILAQLVRRQLVHVERLEGERVQQYSTTPRFLEFFGLASLDDLPRSQDLEVR